MRTKDKPQKKKKGRSVQELIGIKTFTKYGLATNKIIKKDIDFLDHIQMEMATARQFLFIARLKDRKEKQTFEAANRIEKTISEQGFEVQRMKKADIKHFLALYFEASMNGEQMPDIDGEQFYEVDDEASED